MRRNTITIIELIIVLCVVVVAVRVWTYKKPENKTLPPPTSIPQATPTCHPWEDNFYNKQMSIVMQYYNDWEQKSGKKKAIKKTLDWINGKLPSEAPVPEGMVKAYMGGINGTSIMINFNDGTSIGFDTEPLEDMP